MKAKYNNIWFGAVLGLVVPVITIFAAYWIRFGYMDLGEFFEKMIAVRKLSALISLCAVPNLLIFLIFIWLNYLYSARGVLLSTIILGMAMLVIKFLL